MKKAIFAGILSLLFFGCSPLQVSLRKSFDYNKIHNVGIMEFRTPEPKNHKIYGQLAADTFAIEFLKTRFSVVERGQLEAVMKELHLGQSGVVNTREAKEIGKVAGVDAIVLGNISPIIAGGQKVYEQGPTTIRTRPDGSQVVYQGSTRIVDIPPHAELNNISMTAKMVYVETGEVLWAATTEYESIDTQTAIRLAAKEIANGLRKEAKKMTK